MNNILEKNESLLGWQCRHCGAINKVNAAKFCGKCGSARILNDNQPVLKTDVKRDIPNKDEKSKEINSFVSSIEIKEDGLLDNNIIKFDYKNIVDKIKSFLLLSRENLFKTVISGAICLLIISIIAGYQMYTNVNTIRLPKTRFSDVAIDHPVYSVCKKLLGIDAISFRKNLQLAPYEKISAAEWNHVLRQASKHLNQNYSASAYFAPNDIVTVDSLNNKLKSINEDSSEIVDTSRIQSFYMLEQTLFNQI